MNIKKIVRDAELHSSAHILKVLSRKDVRNFLPLPNLENFGMQLSHLLNNAALSGSAKNIFALTIEVIIGTLIRKIKSWKIK